MIGLKRVLSLVFRAMFILSLHPFPIIWNTYFNDEYDGIRERAEFLDIDVLAASLKAVFVKYNVVPFRLKIRLGAVTLPGIHDPGDSKDTVYIFRDVPIYDSEKSIETMKDLQVEYEAYTTPSGLDVFAAVATFFNFPCDSATKPELMVFCT